MATVAEKTNNAFQLKGGLFTLTVLQLHHGDLAAFEEQLSETLKQAPKFFENAPIVIDLNDFDGSKQALDFEAIMILMRKAKLIPFGVRGGDIDTQDKAVKAGLAILHNSPNNGATPPKAKTQKFEKKAEVTEEPSKEETKEVPMTNTRVIAHPVRSGQQIYAKNADLIILSSVSRGAEILADGHIHVYGPLRGRALAGIMGKTDAQIFCKAMDAELISIAGRYLVNEQLDAYKDAEDLHVYLEGEHLKVSTIK